MSSTRSSTLAVAGGVVALAGLAALTIGARRAKVKKTEKDEADKKAAAVAEEKKRSYEAKVSAVVPLAPSKGSDRNARIVGLASAFPPHQYSQSQYLDAFLRNHAGMTAEDEDFTRRVWAGTGFKTCSSYLPESQLYVKMSRSKYVTYVKSSLKDLALRSATEALANWGGDKAKLTHIVFGTMTGTIHAPTMDIEVAIKLGLPSGIKRLNVEGMGCLTGYRALGLASDIARADPSHLVLLIVCDIRSALGNQLSPFKAGDRIDKSNVIVSSLFRDSGASAVISSAALATVPASPSKQPLYEILDHRSHLIPDTFDLVNYHERDDAVIHLYIAKELPGAIKKVLRGQVDALLAPHGVKVEDCSFSVHTGGPKVLEYVAEGVQCSKARMASSWYCMQRWGNLSGSSNLVVLDNWRKLPKEVEADPRRHVVCMSFGPGVGMELLLLRAVAPEVPCN